MSYRFFKILLKTVGVLPFGILYALSDVLAFFLYHIVRYRRKVVRCNLSECFPEKTSHERKQIEKEFYRNFTDYILETCKMGSMSDEEISRRMRFTNIEEVNKVLRSGRSVALYLGHIFNWEWISSMPIHLVKDAVTAQIYHKLSNPAADRLMLEGRASHGATNVEMHKTARFITEVIGEGKSIITGFIADQSPRRKDIKHYVTFLNHRTPVNNGTEKIARHYDFDVWYVYTRKVKRGYYEATYVHIESDPASLPLNRLTEFYYEHLERNIRQEPSLYLWTHRRFKFAEVLNPSSNSL